MLWNREEAEDATQEIWSSVNTFTRSDGFPAVPNSGVLPRRSGAIPDLGGPISGRFTSISR
jgi:hypothetical protein